MNSRIISFMAAIFSIFNTIQFFIIELNQSTYVGHEDRYSLLLDTKSEFVSRLIAYKKTISICLALLTILAGCLLLYCILTSWFMGPLIYTLWIIAYELIHFSMVLLLQGLMKEQFQPLSHLSVAFQVSRMGLHFCCLPFIVRHGYFLYKEPKVVGKLGRHRQSSASTVDMWTPMGLAMIYRKLN
ncbi:putative transmembrane protein 217B [Perognathus longimembris pacificus]|uniref:putative transmembrane protein 217B n=1 Tax=Perognathus longimembris pacificus TaxID=214514 RepID=UPI00201A0147|nr:putative transmembrane protein 217B [Perognathus longimembris pacificus]